MIKQLRMKAVDYLKEVNINQMPNCPKPLYLKSVDASGTETIVSICPHCGNTSVVAPSESYLMTYECPHCRKFRDICFELNNDGTQDTFVQDVFDIVDYDVEDRWLIVVKMAVEYEVTLPKLKKESSIEENLKTALEEGASYKAIGICSKIAYIFSKDLLVPDYSIVGVQTVYPVGKKENGSEIFHLKHSEEDVLPNFIIEWNKSEKYKEFISSGDYKKMGIDKYHRLNMNSLATIGESFELCDLSERI